MPKIPEIRVLLDTVPKTMDKYPIDVIRTVLMTIRMPEFHRQQAVWSQAVPCQRQVTARIGSYPTACALQAPLRLYGKQLPTGSTHVCCDFSRIAAGGLEADSAAS